jgi:predicted secreted hydrolase
MRFLKVLVLATSCVVGMPSCTDDDGAREACPVITTSIELPKDQAPHAGDMEWWYYTGHLRAADGRKWGFELTFFQAYLGSIAGYSAHYAVTDLQKGVHFYDQKFFLPDQPFATLDLVADDWSIRGDGTGARLAGVMDGYVLDLAVTPTKPAVIHGSDGTVDMGDVSPSFYYSQTRMAAVGTLTVDGAAVPVTGIAWMDHQWGKFDVFASNGWDWFSIQLEDQTEVMLYFLHDKEGRTTMTAATVVDEYGCARQASGVEVRPTGSWKSPHTDATYPMGWEVTVGSEDLELTLVPTVLDQEIDARDTTLNTYWEGAVDVTGTRRGRAVTGDAYVELAGYGPWGPQ